MNDNDIMVSPDVLTDSDVSVADETNVTEETELEQTDTELEDEVSATESLTVADTSPECLFTDTNIVAKMDIIIMLLLVMIAIKMLSPLANNHKRLIEKKEK